MVTPGAALPRLLLLAGIVVGLVVGFLTGNSDEQLAQFNFSDLAAGRETLAFYMSVGRLAPPHRQT
jgi:hypothetical protein